MWQGSLSTLVRNPRLGRTNDLSLHSKLLSYSWIQHPGSLFALTSSTFIESVMKDGGSDVLTAQATGAILDDFSKNLLLVIRVRGNNGQSELGLGTLPLMQGLP